jgi:hypothetical protein
MDRSAEDRVVGFNNLATMNASTVHEGALRMSADAILSRRAAGGAALQRCNQPGRRTL